MRNPWIAVVVSAIVAPSASAQPQFFGLGDLPGGAFDSRAYGISSDGRWIVGQATTDQGPVAFRWSLQTGMLPISDGQGLHPVTATAVSADGLAIAGNASGANGTEAFRWSEGGGLVGLGTLGGEWSKANAISADGTTVVGEAQFGPPQETRAFRWRYDTGMVNLGTLPGHHASRAFGVSADGEVAAGESFFPAGAGVRWVADDQIEQIPLSRPSVVSPDGETLLGHGTSQSGAQSLFVWSEANGRQELPGSIYGGGTIWDLSASDDFSLVAMAWSVNYPEPQDALLWRDGYYFEYMGNVLTGEFGLNLDGWDLRSANGVSGDGRTITGWGLNPSGNYEAWVAVIPEPGTLTLVLFSVLTCTRRRSR